MAGRIVRDWYQGQAVTVECEFRLLGVPTNPTVVQCTIRSPSGSETTLNFPSTQLVRRSLGVYEANFVADAGGTWWVRFDGTGVVDAVNEMALTVQPSNVLI